MDQAPDQRMIERVITIPADHPCLPGHFPGRPIVPAVVILDEVRGMIADVLPERRPVSIDHCKFQDFILPDQSFTACLAISGDTTLDFTCKARDDDRLLAKGRFRLEPDEVLA